MDSSHVRKRRLFRRQMILRGLSTRIIVILLGFTLNSGCYLIKQGLSFNSLINTRVPVDQVIERGLQSTDKQAKLEAEQLIEVKKMLAFATNAGLKTGDAYTYYIRLHSPQVSYVVQAAPWDDLKLKTWWFPIVGAVPYLGFYSVDDARDEALFLKNKGFDVSLGGVSAFSSLGWFSDPLLSTMINKNREKIAETLFHELAHRTLWVSGDAEFNEQFAEFIGFQMAVDYLTQENDAEAIQQLKARNEDELKFSHWISDLKEALSTMYEKTRGQDKVEILKQKNALIKNHLQPPLKPAFAYYDYTQRDEWNNASIMASALYQSNKKEWQEAYRCSSSKNLKEFMMQLSQKLNLNNAKPQEHLQSFCKAETKNI